jgi:hypothetical protein
VEDRPAARPNVHPAWPVVRERPFDTVGEPVGGTVGEPVGDCPTRRDPGVTAVTTDIRVEQFMRISP